MERPAHMADVLSSFTTTHSAIRIRLAISIATSGGGQELGWSPTTAFSGSMAPSIPISHPLHSLLKTLNVPVHMAVLRAIWDSINPVPVPAGHSNPPQICTADNPLLNRTKFQIRYTSGIIREREAVFHTSA